MGAHHSKRIGSNPYYAGYERSFERLKSETDKLKVRETIYAFASCQYKVPRSPINACSFCAPPTQVSLYKRKSRENQIGNTIFFYGGAGFALAVIGAAWVRHHSHARHCHTPSLLV